MSLHYKVTQNWVIQILCTNFTYLEGPRPTFWGHHHQSVIPKGRSFTANAGIKVAVLSKDRSSTANSGTKVAGLLGINRCGSFPLLSAPHSLFSIWTDLKRSEKIPGAPKWIWGEWIWLTGPSDFTTGVKSQFHHGFWPDQRSGNPTHPSPPFWDKDNLWLWWTGFSRGFSRFPLPQISFHYFSTLISFISLHFISSTPVMVRQAWSAGIIAIHRPLT